MYRPLTIVVMTPWIILATLLIGLAIGGTH